MHVYIYVEENIMHPLLRISLALVALALAPASVADEVESIEALYAEYRAAVEASDIDGYIAILEPDVRMLPPGADPIVSAAAYRAFLEPVFATATYEIEVEQMPSVELLSDRIAVAEYVYTIALTLKDEDVGVSEPGAMTESRNKARYFDVLRKNASGQWRVWRHTWQGF